MALTHNPQTGTTFAIVFGCNPVQKRQIERRVANATQAALTHPLLLPGILAELERKRLGELLEVTLDRFTLRASGTSRLANTHAGTLHMSEEQMREYLELCYESQNLAKEFKRVKRQLANMVQSCEDMRAFMSGRRAKRGDAMLSKPELAALQNIGVKIKVRTLEIIDDYDNRIDECGMVLDNTSITMQTVSVRWRPNGDYELTTSTKIWNHIARTDAAVNTKISKANTSIALDSKQDNAQMRSIALLTMIYLPVSAVASMFSMTIFDWSPKDGNIVSKYIWVFIVLSLALTVITVLIWYFATHKRKKKGTDSLEELGMSEPGAKCGV
ncbi:hypothetical protein AK830_g10665 [Neonectria ditissima]|uniref:Uncharacterized protein n=1 Tax=Neonectria ditissima TaxID=78410 RepID=A0A0P7B5J3_9HYPO|nr:hypothetical protein AK830_g10665 [Neonectria ditissima]